MTRTRTLVAVMAIVLAVTGCGGGSDGSSTSTTGPSSQQIVDRYLAAHGRQLCRAFNAVPLRAQGKAVEKMVARAKKDVVPHPGRVVKLILDSCRPF